jgi:ectoine hydroxylase-related dioxygenase (phytanoyl-CoA dioxygenase family)
MRFACGSHRWGFLNAGDFFGSDQDWLLEQIPIPDGEQWVEDPAVLPPGAVSFHHRYTYHGSGPNVSSEPRISFAIHLRTEKSTPRPGFYYTDHLDDPVASPIIYDAR